MRIPTLAILLTVLPTFTHLHAESRDALASAANVAEAYGIDAWSGIKRVAFTFNVEAPQKSVTRSWVWEPREDRVTRTGSDGEATTYLRSEASSDKSLAEIDQQFINDSYWLVFPFHLVWDTGTTLTEKAGPLPLPIGEGDAAKSLTIQYAADVGYTPGDAYDLYLDADDDILAWSFRKGGADEVSLATTWSTPTNFGPIRISTDHIGENNFRLFFTDVAVDAD